MTAIRGAIEEVDMKIKRKAAIPRTIVVTTDVKGRAVYATNEHNPRFARANDDGTMTLCVAVRVDDRTVSFCWQDLVSEATAIQWLAEQP